MNDGLEGVPKVECRPQSALGQNAVNVYMQDSARPELLEVLSSDARPVAERVHRLLLPFYFAGPEEGPACMAALLRQSPEVPTLQLIPLMFISRDVQSTISVCMT